MEVDYLEQNSTEDCWNIVIKVKNFVWFATLEIVLKIKVKNDDFNIIRLRPEQICDKRF